MLDFCLQYSHYIICHKNWYLKPILPFRSTNLFLQFCIFSFITHCLKKVYTSNYTEKISPSKGLFCHLSRAWTGNVQARGNGTNSFHLPSFPVRSKAFLSQIRYVTFPVYLGSALGLPRWHAQKSSRHHYQILSLQLVYFLYTGATAPLSFF